MSGIVLFGAGAVAPAPSLSAARASSDEAGSDAISDSPDLSVQPPEPPSPAPEGEDADPVEVPELRTLDSRTVRNADGTYTTEYFADAVHFHDAAGAWQPIEAVPVESNEPGKAFETKRGPVMVRFSDSSVLGDLVTVTGGEDSVRYRASLPVALDGVAVPNDVAPVSDGTHVTYPGLYDGVDIRYTLLAGGVKEDIVLTEPGAPNRFAFVLDAPGLRADLQDDGSVTLSRGGEVRFRIPAPFMVDSADELDGDGARSDAVSYQLIEVARVKVLIVEADQAWLDDSARVYPVYVDPSTTNEPYYASLDTFISSAYPSYVLDDQWNPAEGGYYELWNGRYDATSGTNYAFVKTGIPSNKTIISAKFRIYVQHSYSLATPTSIYLGRLTSSFTEAQTWNMTHPTYVQLGSDSVADNQWAEWTVTGTVESWVYGSATNYGFRIYESSTSQSLWKRLRARENSTNTPTLLVTWAVPAATSVSPSGGAWTNSTLLDWNYSSEGSGDPQTKFQAQVSTSSSTWSGSSLKVDSGQVSSSATSWTAPTTSLSNGTTYYWRVRVYDGHTWSAWSSVQSFKRDAASPTFTSTTVGGAITATDPNYYDLGNGMFTVKIRGADANSGIKLSYLRLYNATDEMRVSHDWSSSNTTNCNEFNTSTLVDATACSRTYNSGGTREVQFTVVGLNQNASFDIQYYFTDYAGNTLGYADTGKNLIFDATAPTAVITSPGADSTVSGSVPITGTADDENFSEYQLHYESAGTPGTWDPIGTNPYSSAVTNGTLGTWNTDALSNGAYTLRLRVYDKARVGSGFTEVLRTVTVANGSPLTAEITAPGEGSVVEDLVSMSGTASAASDFESYELHYGSGCSPTSWLDIGVNPRTDPVTNGLLGSWDAAGLHGDHALRLTVHQLGGATATDSVCVHVGPRLPEVSVTAPADSTTVFAVENLTATASHLFGITNVEFLVDGTVIGSDGAAPYELTWDTATVIDGAHVITARATAVTGEVGTSPEVAVEVGNGLSADERVDADFEAGRLTPDEHAVSGVYALGVPGLLDARYQSPSPSDGGATGAVRYLQTWDSLTQQARDEITAFLNQPMRGSLYGAVVVEQGAAANSLNGPSPLGGPDTCDLVQHDPSGPWPPAPDTALKCRHDTTHFEIYYTLDGTGRFAVDTLSPTPDDLSEDTFGPCQGRIDPDTCNGVPDYIDKIAQGLEDAYAIYTDPAQLNFPAPWAGRTPVIIRGDLTGGQVMPNFLNPFEDAETIEIELASGAPYYLAHHELFHVFQYQFVLNQSMTVNQVAGIGPWWWMEATADWAAGHVARSGEHGDPTAYAGSLVKFFTEPGARLDTFQHPHQYPFPRRQYGAFVFAEYLAENLGAGGPGQPAYNAAIIHETWDAVGDLPVPQMAIQAFDGVAQAHGTNAGQLLSDFNRANYLLEYDDSVGGGPSDVESLWRGNLQDNPPTAGDRTEASPDGLAPARPNRQQHPIQDGQRVEGGLTAWYGGATYVEVIPPASTTGTLVVDVSGADAAAVDIRILTLDYRLSPADPLICDDEKVTIDGSGNGVAGVGIDGGCRYAVLIFSGLLDGTPQPFDWGAQFIATPDQAYCVESFSRTVAPGGWGMSELGVPWINWTLGPNDPQASVNGSAGVIQGSLNSRLAAENLELSLPIEVLVRWRFIGDGDPVDNYFEVHLQHYDSARDSSAAYSRDFTGGTDFSKTFANHDGAQSIGTAAVAAPDGQWMWIRQRLTGTETSLRVWQDGQAEPTTWQRSINGTAFPAPPDVITIFANGDEVDQGVEVDSITVDVGCVTAAYTDPFDRVVAENSGTSAGWGFGPLGEWRYGARSSAGLWQVDGDEAIHTATEPGTTFASVDMQSLLGLAPRSEIELLVKWRVDANPPDNVWSFEAYFSDALGITDDYAGVGIAGFSADEAFVNAGITYAAWSDFYNAAPGYPRPMHDKDVWLRLLVDEYGVYARLWEDGQPEPVTTGGVVPSVGGRGEHWHTYETNHDGIPPMVWRYLELRASGGNDTTRIDSVTVILP